MIERVGTGNPQLDRILGGGIPVGSLLVLAGAPGTGKTILAQQVCFSNGTSDNRAIYYTTLSEPHSKMVRHLDGFDFFDRSKLGVTVELNHLSTLAKEGDLATAVSEVVRHSFDVSPSVVVIDSTKALHEAMERAEHFRSIVYDLASRIAHTNSVLIFVGEYSLTDVAEAPEFAVADAIVYMANESEGVLDQRSLRVLKLRGSDYLSGTHSFTIDKTGIAVYPRQEVNVARDVPVGAARVSTGVPGLDEMIAGGIPETSVTLIAGPSGGGKTVVGMHFIADGLSRGEKGVYVSLQESEGQLVAKAQSFGWNFKRAVESGDLVVRHFDPVELNLDRVATEIIALADSGARRLVIDSMGELEHAAHGAARFPDYLWALMSGLRARGMTVLVTSETAAFFGPAFELARGLSFVVDNVILLRYTELESEIRRALTVVKMRESDHVKSLVEFEIGEKGASVKGKFAGVSGVLTGTPVRTEEKFREFFNR
ncbi:MAG TPA: ATPase domain-containing protein [Actinomycetota bacterium]|nr:ATPase domain-containing protein [Actinomycetota bacterium]